MRTAALLALGLILAAPAEAGEETSVAPKTVLLRTRDGLVLEADWYRGEDGMPGIVGLHMYPADRTSWRPLAEKRPEGYHFLAVDLRGYGGSRVQEGKNLSERVKARDPQLFQAMWQDAEAAVKYLRGEAKCDPKRIGIVGASVGCSLAFDMAVRDGKIAGVACLSPGTNYFGIPSIDHVKSWSAGMPLLLVSPEGEADAGARPLAAELKGRSEVEVRIVPGGRDLHGTHMLEKVAGTDGRLIRWFRFTIGSQVLDGTIDATERGHPEGCPLRCDAFGITYWSEWLHVDPPAPRVLVSVETREKVVMVLTGEASGDGTLLRAAVETIEGGRKSGKPLGTLRGAAIAKGRVMELRIPWTVFGLKPGTTVALHAVLGDDPSGRQVSANAYDEEVPVWW